MPREATFQIAHEIPRNPRARIAFKFELESLLPQVGCFGKDGRVVGIGFDWRTQTGLGNGGLHGVCTLLRKVNRAFLAVGILSRQADTFPLTSRIRYIRDGEPSVTFSLVEE